MVKTSLDIEKMHKGQVIRDIVKEEINHIPRGSASQNELRMFYWPLRMSSLGKKAEISKTKREVLNEAVEAVKKTYPKFIPKYDEKFFQDE
jgi:hypothetical protein